MNNNVAQPYISFVICARNDNYGGDFNQRMQGFVTTLGVLAERYALDMELVMVEWNPPQDKKSLRDEIQWPDYLSAGRLRWVTVPPETHLQFPNAEKISLFEYMGKNAGIRHARGTFVLTTNPDIRYSEALIQFFAAQQLRADCFYRVDRYDIAVMPRVGSVDEHLAYCRKHWFQVHTGHGRVIKGTVRYAVWLLKKMARQMMRMVWGRTSGRLTATHVVQRSQLHTRTAGDFLLMARSAWERLRGYPEFYTYSHLDGYACAQAAGSGLLQVVLHYPLVIYHEEHGREENKDRPMTDLGGFFHDCDELLAGKRSLVYNTESWGVYPSVHQS